MQADPRGSLGLDCRQSMWFSWESGKFPPLTWLPTCWKRTVRCVMKTGAGAKVVSLRCYFNVAPESPPVFMTPLGWLAKGSLRKFAASPSRYIRFVFKLAQEELLGLFVWRQTNMTLRSAAHFFHTNLCPICRKRQGPLRHVCLSGCHVVPADRNGYDE